MKLLVAGTRGLQCDELLEQILDNHPGITEIVSGMEPTGIDACGVRWADAHGIPVQPFPAEWNRYSRRSGDTLYTSNPAGFNRNEEMAVYCDGAVVIWDGSSPGSRDMLKRLRHYGKPVDEVVIGAPRLVF